MLTAVAGLLLATSCSSSFLDTEPTDAVSSDQVAVAGNAERLFNGACINGKTNCSLFSKHFAQDFVLLTQNKMYILLFPIICFSDFVLSLLLLS